MLHSTELVPYRSRGVYESDLFPLFSMQQAPVSLAVAAGVPSASHGQMREDALLCCTAPLRGASNGPCRADTHILFGLQQPPTPYCTPAASHGQVREGALLLSHALGTTRTVYRGKTCPHLSATAEPCPYSSCF